ncbi:MAG: ammonium transporter [Bacillota bacterium]|nr:ammonium transporter [Bacillota bacterium]
MKKMVRGSIILLLVTALLNVFSIFAFADDAPAPVGDPAGTNITSVSDIPAKEAGKPTQDEINAQVASNRLGVNYVWVAMTAMLVFFFQAGFAMVETGFVRAKNAMHTMAMNFMVFLVGAIGYYICGFALQFGGVGSWPLLGSGTSTLNHEITIGGLGILGTKGFFLTSGGTYDTGVYLLFFFQMVFMDTTCTIPTGAVAERVKYSAIVVGSFFVSMIYYPLFGNWMWGGGWLSQLGAKFGLGHGGVDFAGSAVVHAMGGMMAFASAIVIGPRIGKYKKDGTSVAFPGHDLCMAIIGTILLFFCWFAFNAGSTMSGTDFRLSVVMTNTMLAGAVGGFVAMMYMWARYGKPDPSMTINGCLAGLVAITAPCAFVSSISACIIAIIAGFLVCFAVEFIDKKLKVDDPVGAIAVHGVNGVWGVISLGLFADGTYGNGLNGVSGGVKGLFFGDPGQLVAQLIVVLVLIVWGFGSSFLFYKILDKIMGIRVSPEVELQGLDIPEMGIGAYADFAINNSSDGK